MTDKKTSIALFSAVALGILGAASVAQAGNQGEDTGGFVIAGSTDGVNPVYHLGWFCKAHNVGRADNAFAYAPARSSALRIPRPDATTETSKKRALGAAPGLSMKLSAAAIADTLLGRLQD